MAMAKNFRSRGEGRPLPEALSGTMLDESPESRGLVERLGGGKGFVSN